MSTKKQSQIPERKCPQCNRPSLGFVKGMRHFIEFCDIHSPYIKQDNGVWQYRGIPNE